MIDGLEEIDVYAKLCAKYQALEGTVAYMAEIFKSSVTIQ